METQNKPMTKMKSHNDSKINDKSLKANEATQVKPIKALEPGKLTLFSFDFATQSNSSKDRTLFYFYFLLPLLKLKSAHTINLLLAKVF